MNIKEFWSKYTGQATWMQDRTIYLTKYGSNAYGTATPESDLDIRGICIPPKQYFFGFCDKFEQAERGWTDIDCVIFNLQKFVSLAAQNNPSVLEIMFTDQSDWLYSSPEWLKIHAIRDSFLSKNVRHRFGGYAHSQLNKIKTHRDYLLNPKEVKPMRADFGLPETSLIPKEQREALEAMISKTIDGWNLDLTEIEDGQRILILSQFQKTLADMKLAGDDLFVAAGNKVGLDSKAMEYLKAEHKYRQALNQYKQYQDWKTNRNPKRKVMEARFGYDLKHASQLIRLFRMGLEILNGDGVIVKRPDAKELLEIKNGVWSFEKVLAYVESMDIELEKAFLTSKLPNVPDRKMIDKVLIEVIESLLS